MVTRIDDRGRILIPRDLREKLGLESGQDVRVDTDGHGNIIIHPVLPVEEFLDSMKGVINETTRKDDAEPMDPLDIKRMWEPSP